MTTSTSIPDISDEDTFILNLLLPPSGQDIIQVADDDDDTKEYDIASVVSDHQRRKEVNNMIGASKLPWIGVEENKAAVSNFQPYIPETYEPKLKLNEEEKIEFILEAMTAERPFTTLEGSFGSSSSSFITPPSTPPSPIKLRMDSKDVEPSVWEASYSTMPHATERVKQNSQLSPMTSTSPNSSNLYISTGSNGDVSLQELSSLLKGSRETSTLSETNTHSPVFASSSHKTVKMINNSPLQKMSLASYDSASSLTTEVSQNTKSSSVLPANCQSEKLTVTHLTESNNTSVIENSESLSLSTSARRRWHTPQSSFFPALKSVVRSSTSSQDEAIISYLPQEFQSLYKKFSREKQNFLGAVFKRRNNIMQILNKYKFENPHASNPTMYEKNEECTHLSQNPQNSNFNSANKNQIKTSKQENKKSVKWNSEIDVIEINSKNSKCNCNKHKCDVITNSNNNGDSPMLKKIQIDDNILNTCINNGENSINLSSTSSSSTNMNDEWNFTKARVYLKSKAQNTPIKVNNASSNCEHILDLSLQSSTLKKHHFIDDSSNVNYSKTRDFDRHSQVGASDEKSDQNGLSTIRTAVETDRSKFGKLCDPSKVIKQKDSTNTNPFPPKRSKTSDIFRSSTLNTTSTLLHDDHHNNEQIAQPSSSKQQRKASVNRISNIVTQCYEVVAMPNGTTIKIKKKNHKYAPNVCMKDIKKLQCTQNQGLASNHTMYSYQNNKSNHNNIYRNQIQHLARNSSQIFSTPKDYEQVMYAYACMQ